MQIITTYAVGISGCETRTIQHRRNYGKENPIIWVRSLRIIYLQNSGFLGGYSERARKWFELDLWKRCLPTTSFVWGGEVLSSRLHLFPLKPFFWLWFRWWRNISLCNRLDDRCFLMFYQNVLKICGTGEEARFHMVVRVAFGEAFQVNWDTQNDMIHAFFMNTQV